MMKGGSLRSAGGSDVNDLERASKARLEDAETLFASGRYSSSITMGIYALEIRLKVVICRRLDLQELPKFFQTHNLEELLIASGLSQKILHVKKPRNVSKNWDALVIRFSQLNDLRYKDDPKFDKIDAEALLAQLRGNPGGVLQWLEKQIASILRSTSRN